MTVLSDTTSLTEYEAKRAARLTKRQERETKRKYEFLAGQVRSQLRKQLDEILKLNTKAFVFLLLQGGALKVGVEAIEQQPEPVIDAPVIADEDRTPPSFFENPVEEPPPLLVSI